MGLALLVAFGVIRPRLPLWVAAIGDSAARWSDAILGRSPEAATGPSLR